MRNGHITQLLFLYPPNFYEKIMLNIKKEKTFTGENLTAWHYVIFRSFSTQLSQKFKILDNKYKKVPKY